MWKLDHKEGWAPKNWCFWTVVLEKTLESPLHCKEIKPVNPKGNQLWIFIGRTDDEGVAPILWPPHVKSWLIGKDPDAGKDWKQEEKGITEDKMVGWHHQLDGHEILQALGDGEGQGSLQTAVHGVTKSQTRLSSSNNHHPDWCTLAEYNLASSHCSPSTPTGWEHNTWLNPKLLPAQKSSHTSFIWGCGEPRGVVWAAAAQRKQEVPRRSSCLP